MNTLLSDIEVAAADAQEGPTIIEKLILKHAMRSFGRRGYSATTLRSVASEANVTAPMVSYYFKSKENLYLRVAEIVMESMEAEVAKALEPSPSFREAVTAIVRANIQLVERSPSAVEFMLSLLYGPQERQPAPDIERMYAGTRRHLLETFERGIASGELVPRPGVDAEFLAEQLGSLIHDFVSQRFRADRIIERHPERREAVEARMRARSIDVSLDIFFHGVGELATDNS